MRTMSWIHAVVLSMFFTTLAHAATPPRLSHHEIAGVYALTQSSTGFSDSVYQLNITGMALRVPWKDLEPTKGNYVWTRLDTLINKCRANGKKAKMFIMAGNNVPAWVGAAKVTGTQTPVPWDPNLRTELKVLINAIGNRYRDVPELAFFQIVGPSAQWAELDLPAATRNMPGYSNAVIFECWKEAIDEWRKVRGNKRLACSVSDAPTWYATLDDDICNYSVGQRLNVNDHGVLGKDFYPEWCWLDSTMPGIKNEANRWTAKTYVGTQFWGSTTWTSPKTTNFAGTMALAMECNSSFIEIYQEDLKISSLAAIAEDYDAQIKAKFPQTGTKTWAEYE